ncbi:hypothetical protein D8B26_005301 [Coccidioides posadasii str. Silveira]|uniref:Predicted protein n=2 Tax=Coccidioides posadasii TaxID=199306 RepID=E9D4V2_COCPS|nr:predicted protein [Coccidioides posadasii str. Silveira]QVM10648.1 hypothetical protein D8B26_005301 [Coccidioides posadasii str. Silveira]
MEIRLFASTGSQKPPASLVMLFSQAFVALFLASTVFTAPLTIPGQETDGLNWIKREDQENDDAHPLNWIKREDREDDDAHPLNWIKREDREDDDAHPLNWIKREDREDDDAHPLNWI